MGESPDNDDLWDVRIEPAVLRESMKVMEANLSSTLDRFRADMAGLKADMKKRDKGNLIQLISVVGTAVTVLGVLIQFS